MGQHPGGGRRLSRLGHAVGLACRQGEAKGAGPVAFRIQPHMRLHEWVADEAGFFRDEGLEYEFEAAGFAAGTAAGETVTPAGEQPAQIRSGAFEDMARGRESDVSCACHW